MTSTVLSLDTLTDADAPLRCVIYTRLSRDAAKEAATKAARIADRAAKAAADPDADPSQSAELAALAAKTKAEAVDAANEIGRAVARQEKACRALAASRGWLVIAVFTENDTSATKGKRPRYKEMIEMVKGGHCDVIVGWAVDRLTRSPREIEDLITLSETTGVKIATVSGDLDLTTDAGRLVGRVLGGVARGETERKAARQKAANLDRAQMGKPPAVRAFGYHRDGTIDQAEADEVRAAYARFIAGAGVKTIQKDLNKRGVVNTRGTDWTLFGVSKMLKNPRYIAQRWLDRKAPGTNRVVPVYIGPGAWEPLVDNDTYQAVQTKLADPARHKNANGPTRKHFGSGLYECGVCADGTKVKAWQEHSRHTTKDGKSHLAIRFLYLCRKQAHLARKGSDIDAYVMGEIVAFLRHPKNSLAKLMTSDRDVKRSRELRDEEIGLLERVDSLGDELALKAATPGRTSALLVQAVEKALVRIEARLTEIAAEQAALGARSSLALLEGSADPGQAFLDLPVAERNKIAGDLARWVLRKGKPGPARFDSDSVDIHWFRDFRDDQLAVDM